MSPVRQPSRPERAEPPGPAARRALQDAPRVREGAPQRLRRRSDPRRSPGPPPRRLRLTPSSRYGSPAGPTRPAACQMKPGVHPRKRGSCARSGTLPRNGGSYARLEAFIDEAAGLLVLGGAVLLEVEGGAHAGQYDHGVDGAEPVRVAEAAA